ncbi:MAG: hypothetical protein JSR27_08150 [Proteobacteria bacterium]|nr:hypothetical protein [Pseudomonadota bacterium]
MKSQFMFLAAVFGAVLSCATAKSSAAIQTASAPKLVYLNTCIGGCPIYAGNDNAVNRYSSVIYGAVTVQPFAYSSDTFAQIAACTRAVLEPFNIKLTVHDPGNLPRDEVLLTTTGTSMGLQDGIGLMAPFTGAYQPNTLGFVFASAFGGNVDEVCWSTAMVIGELFSLNRVTPCADLMSFASGCGEKAFTNADSACDGTNFGTPGKCFSGASTQNSFAILTTIAGPVDTVFAQGFDAWELPHAGPSP